MKRPARLHLSTAAAGTTLALLLAGCSSPSYSPLAGMNPAAGGAHPGSAAPDVVVLSHEPAPVIGLDNVEPDSRTLASATSIPPPRMPAPSFGRGWIPLRTWSDRCGLQKPERINAGSAVAYRVWTKNGWCKLTIGSRLAHWNGIAIWLGFPPQMVRGEPHIQALDAEKTLMPLAEPADLLTLRQRIVVLDPGHGGTDSGTRDAYQHLEKELTLDWALRTERLLTNAGWKVFLTRRSDVDVSLGERTAIADRVRADLFISLHFNSTFPQTQPSGIETYCLTPMGMPSTLLRGFADDERALFPNNTVDAGNLAWAYQIHTALLQQTGANDAGIKRARFMGVLRNHNRPAILVEGGFLSNQRDAASLSLPAYRDQLALAIAAALK
jgi:N-acetylmuramoyl-L-alanine amidase